MLALSLSLSLPCLIHVYVLSDDMKYKREKSRRTVFFSLSFCLSVCLSVSLSRLIHIYVLVKLYFFIMQNMYMHFFTIPKLGAKRLGGKRLGGGGDGMGGGD